MTEPHAPTTILPDDYYRSIYEVEQNHWWHRGMREIAAALLADRLTRRDQSLLDVGCGTGGFLGWAASTGSFTRIAGTDISGEAVELARDRVPAAELARTDAAHLPFADASFDLVTLNDVLQHIDEKDVGASLAELRRVLRPGGALLLRTNGARNGRRDAADWRVYDAGTLRAELEKAGFSVARISYVNAVLSVWGQVRGRAPRVPDEGSHGIPRPAGALPTAVGSRLLGAEAWFLRASGRRLPYGHTLVALATPSVEPQTRVGEFFDEESARYDAVYDASSTGGRILRARLATALNLAGTGPGTALDAGMGAGRLVSALDRAGWTVSGIDISEQMVDLARRGLPHLDDSLRRGDVEALPFEPESFDLAVATGVLEYAVDLRRALHQLVGVVKPGGRIVLSYPDYAAPYSVAQMRLWYPAVRTVKRLAPFGRPAPQTRRHLVAPDTFRDLLETEGLTVEAIVPLGPRPVPLALAATFERSGGSAAAFLATQFVLAARRPPSRP